MALHRDIYWVGRQWAVTGHGMQTVDQKLKGKFDIEVARLWEDGLLESLRTERWLMLRRNPPLFTSDDTQIGQVRGLMLDRLKALWA